MGANSVIHMETRCHRYNGSSIVDYASMAHVAIPSPWLQGLYAFQQEIKWCQEYDIVLGCFFICTQAGQAVCSQNHILRRVRLPKTHIIRPPSQNHILIKTQEKSPPHSRGKTELWGMTWQADEVNSLTLNWLLKLTSTASLWWYSRGRRAVLNCWWRVWFPQTTEYSEGQLKSYTQI